LNNIPHGLESSDTNFSILGFELGLSSGIMANIFRYSGLVLADD